MLACLPALFFFAVLMGSPVIGFLLFTLLGLVHLGKIRFASHARNAFEWTRQDAWLALSFVSIPLFKMLSALWSTQPELAFENAAWHAYFLFWPLVLMGIHHCQSNVLWAERSLALGLIAYGLYAIGIQLSGGAILDPDRQNVGVLAQLAMALGGWNLLMLTRPGPMPGLWRGIHAVALVATLVALLSSTRRLELLGFMALAGLILLWRLRSRLNRVRALSPSALLLLLAGFLLYLRREKFMLGLQELQSYMAFYETDIAVKLTSWGARLEMWRTGLSAFADQPWLGLSAQARPSGMQAWGAPPAEVFGHRHFHSHLIQTLVEGGLVGLLVMVSSLGISIRLLITGPWRRQTEVSLLGLALLMAYAMEGSFSAALFYDKPNSYLVVATAWLWLRLRVDGQEAAAETVVAPPR